MIPKFRTPTRRAGGPASAGAQHPAAATLVLALVQVVVWVVVRRYHYPDASWLSFALRPDQPIGRSWLVAPFIHLDPVHLGINLAALYLLGAALERKEGAVTLLWIYLGSGWFSTAMQWAALTAFAVSPASDNAPAAIGASGAVAGLIGAVLVRFPHLSLQAPLWPQRRLPVRPLILLWLLYTLVRTAATTLSGSPGAVGHWAHLTGFLFGLAGAQAVGFHRAGRAECLQLLWARARRASDSVTAARALGELIQLRPNDATARQRLVEALVQLGEWGSARRVAIATLQRLLQSGDRSEACRVYGRLDRGVPQLDLPPGLRYRAATWLIDTGNPREGVDALVRASSEETDAGAAAQAMLRAADVAAEKLSDPQLARRLWKETVRSYPDSDAARRANALLNQTASREEGDDA